MRARTHHRYYAEYVNILVSVNIARDRDEHPAINQCVISCLYFPWNDAYGSVDNLVALGKASGAR